MSTETLLRFGLLAVGLLAFGAGIRDANETLRWIGIALVSLALIVRLIHRIRRR